MGSDLCIILVPGLVLLEAHVPLRCWKHEVMCGGKHGDHRNSFCLEACRIQVICQLLPKQGCSLRAVSGQYQVSAWGFSSRKRPWTHVDTWAVVSVASLHLVLVLPPHDCGFRVNPLASLSLGSPPVQQGLVSHVFLTSNSPDIYFSCWFSIISTDAMLDRF